MTTGKTIVVLGAGIGGIVTASLLRKRLAREHRVVLVERETRHLFATSLLWLMVGRRTEERISRPLARLAKRGIELVRGEIERINPKTRSVHVGGQEIAADYLVIALGAELAPEAIPGLTEAGHNFYTLAGAQSLDARAHAAHAGPSRGAGERHAASNARRRRTRGRCCSRTTCGGAACAST